MRKFLITSLIGICSVLVLGAFIDLPLDDGLTKILSRFEAYTLNRPQEKLYLHVDKPLYVAGEDIWFSTYLVNAGSLKPDSISRTIYVELFNDTNTLLQRRVLYSPDGTSHGDFTLAENLPQGKYTIRAYTNYMKNADEEFFFTKEISVINLTENSRSPIPLANTTPDLQFFPEGGDMLVDVENQLAFKAVNQTGKSIQVEGEISDETGKIITSFRSEHDGMGLFRITPLSNHHYTATIKNSGYSFPLPTVSDKGYMLRVTDMNSDIRITAYSNLKKFSTDPCIIYLVAQSRGAICYAAKGEITNTALGTKIPKNKLPTGIVQITLFDGSGVPQCERLFFINHQSELTLSLKPDQAEYDKKKAVTIDMDVRRKDDTSVKGNFSFSIFDGSRISAEEYPATIVNNLLLTSDLKGHIENPGYYLKDTLQETKHHLDLLMMTHGWRRFRWETILKDNLDPVKYYAEGGIVISGIVQKELSKKPSVNSSVKIFTQQKDILILKTDSLGRFYTDELSFYDSAQLMIQTDNPKGKQSDLQFKLNPFNIPPKMQSISMASDTEDLKNFLEKVRNGNIILPFTTKTTILKEVEVKATRIKETDDNTFKLYGVPDATINMKDVPQGFANILQAIQGRVAGVTVSGNNVSIRGGGSPLFLLNGMPVDSSIISSLSVYDVESIDVLKNPGTTSLYGMRGGNGVIAINMKKGHTYSAPTVGIHTLKYPGFYKAREFYSPNYSVADLPQDSLDVRNTLYWNPAVKSNSDGKARIHFFTSNVSSSYKIIVEGISDDGIPGYTAYDLIVK